MRPTRTPAENRILERLGAVLPDLGYTACSVAEDVTDRPDIVVRGHEKAIGIEVCRLDYEDYCRWLAVPPSGEYARAAEVTIDLARMLKRVIEAKRDKHQTYKSERNLDECWLVLHNDLLDLPEVAEAPGIPDRRWLEDHAHFELQDLMCPFERVLFNLEHPDRWYTLFDQRSQRVRDRQVAQWPTVIRRESALEARRGVNVVDLSNAIPRERFP